ncbi:MAG: hypothetical protein C5B50_05530 [Verrucomicrobia bacterium]|nr:MAG: hypothetical protein C5B50_05530 [Verrucomicrobiota bacterium]
MSPPGGSRRQRALNEPAELYTRLITRCVIVVRIPPKDLQRLSITAHPFESDNSAEFHDEACPARPHSHARTSLRLHEIESGDYFWLVAKDYFQKPLSNVAGHSRGTTLYGT